MELKVWLSFLMLCVIPDAQSDKHQWMIQVPSEIPAVHGSCVVIPCVYSYPKSKSKVFVNRWIGTWWRKRTLVSINLRYKLTDEFKRRTQFLGKLQRHNCTMLLDVVRNSDVGPFYFRIEIPQHRRAHSFTNNTVSLNILHNPEPPTLSVTVTNKVQASCTVSHSCPFYLPRISWNHAGVIKHQSKKLNEWKWETESQLTFTPQTSEFNQTLSCTVTYRGGKKTESSTTLNDMMGSQ